MRQSGSITKKIAILFLVLMCIQYIPIEGNGVSNVKFVAMCLTPFIWIRNVKRISKPFIWGGLYLVIVGFSAMYNEHAVRVSSLIYKCSFFVMFIMYYDLINFNKVFTIDNFISFLKKFIIIFTLFLILQQIAIIIGLRSFPLINFMNYLDRGIGSNSLSLEPSHFARVLTVLMLVLLRMYEVKWGKSNVTIRNIYKDAKWVVIAFLWSMFTMGSGTAFVGLAILSLFFLRKQYLVPLSTLLVVFYFSIPYINFEPFNRAKNVLEASMTLDSELVKDVDHSASARIVPLIATFQNADILSDSFWIGKGEDQSLEDVHAYEEKSIGGINEYGFLSYIALLIFFRKCCLDKIISTETIVFIFLLSASISNIAYVWGILLLFTTVKSFKNKEASSLLKPRLNIKYEF